MNMSFPFTLFAGFSASRMRLGKPHRPSGLRAVNPQAFLAGSLLLLLCFSLTAPVCALERDAASTTALLPTIASESADERLPPEIRKLREMLKEGTAAFSAAEIKTFFPKIVPLVEKAAGRTFKKVPTWQIVDRKKMEQILMADILPQLENLLPQATAEQRQEFARRQADGMTALLLGKFGFSDGILYLLPRNFFPLFSITRVSPDQVTSILQLIIAHELTHALQDQEIQLQKSIEKIKDNEMGLAFNATIEGHAVFVMEKVGHELGLASSVIEASKLFAAGSVTFDDPALQMVNKVMSMQYESIYLGGKRFIEYWVKKSGPEIVWDILKTPPTRTSVIMTPASYGSSGESNDEQIPLKEWLSGLEKFLGKPPVQVQNVEVGIMNLAAAWANMEAPQREELLAGIEKTQALVVVATATASMGNVSLMILKEPGKAPLFIQYLEEMARQNLKLLQSDQSSMKVTNIEINDYPLLNASPSRRFAFTIQAKDQEPQKQIIYRFSTGHLLVEIFDGNVGIPAADIREIARLILDLSQKNSGKAKK